LGEKYFLKTYKRNVEEKIEEKRENIFFNCTTQKDLDSRGVFVLCGRISQPALRSYQRIPKEMFKEIN